MSKEDKALAKKATDYFFQFAELHTDLFVFHDYRYINETITNFKELAKGEGVDKNDYELALVALILTDLGSVNNPNPIIDNTTLVNRFLEKTEVDEKDKSEILYYINFLRDDKTPKNEVEKVVRDAKDIHLGLPDALERLSLLQIQEEKLTGKSFSDIEWLQRCKHYFITHNFDTHYANKNYGLTRGKNYIELEKRIDKLRSEDLKEKRTLEKQTGGNSLIGKENEDLFKIAFRNYLNLIALADRKAGLLIQVNSILAPVVVALVLQKLEYNWLFALPTAGLLLGSALTIFYSILASKPLENWNGKQQDNGKEQFFFGSFDRLDPKFANVTWQKYSADMEDFFGGDKTIIFEELIKESYEVRKVLSKKFGFLSIAYKIFFAGLVLSIVGFLIVLLNDRVSQQTQQKPNTEIKVFN